MDDTRKDSIEGEFLRRSKYFKAGADYRALVIVDQVNQNISKSEDSRNDRNFPPDVAQSVAKDMEDEKKEVATVCSIAWLMFSGDLNFLQANPEALGKIVADDKLVSMMASNPYQDQATSSN